MHALRATSNVEVVRGVENSAKQSSARPDLAADPSVETISFAPDHRPFAEFLFDESIDTVIQCGLVLDRTGLVSRASEADVIATMSLGAAIGRQGSRVRNWVIASSSAIYPIGSHSPLLQRESQPIPHEEGSVASSIVEAEAYARDVAIRFPHVNVAILRLQQLIGPKVRGPLAALLAADPTPAPMGFDAAIQLLHLEDAASAISFASESELAGVYNVASAGVIRLSDALRFSGRRRFPVLPLRAPLIEPLLARLNAPHLPSDLFDLLLFGHALDTQKIERVGWKPLRDQRSCVLEA